MKDVFSGSFGEVGPLPHLTRFVYVWERDYEVLRWVDQLSVSVDKLLF